MHSISDLRKLVEDEIKKLDFKGKPYDLYNPVSYMLSLPAKRMRPVLVLGSCDLFGGDIHSAIPQALGIEVFHNFTLLHDDIMDNAPLRRAQQTVHEKWNTNIAILSGDTMFVKSCQLMMSCEKDVMQPVMELFHKTAIQVCEGQQLDMDFENSNKVSVEEYLHMITNKTAVLLGASLKTGAIIANSSHEDAKRIYNFGVYIGVAFQLQDDILDVFSDDVGFGKVKGGDILADKKTFLWIKAHELASGNTRKLLDKCSGNKILNPTEKVKAITNVYKELRIRELAESEMDKYFDKAIIELDSINVHESQKTILRTFAEQLMIRKV